MTKTYRINLKPIILQAKSESEAWTLFDTGECSEIIAKDMEEISEK